MAGPLIGRQRIIPLAKPEPTENRDPDIAYCRSPRLVTVSTCWRFHALLIGRIIAIFRLAQKRCLVKPR